VFFATWRRFATARQDGVNLLPAWDTFKELDLGIGVLLINALHSFAFLLL
jgi:hypothetical protein